MAKMGRPSIYTEDIAKEILHRMAEGETLMHICEDVSMPCRRTVQSWMDTDATFCARYARARELQADALAESMAELERQTLSGELDSKAANVVLASRRWRAEKMGPKRYGHKAEVEHTGPGGEPLFNKIEVVIVNAPLRDSR